MFSKNTKKIISFLRLIRLHRSIPTLLLILPGVIILLSEFFYSLKNNVNLISNPFLLFFKIAIGGFCARSLGCIINDYFDQKIDSSTRRTEDRPFISTDQKKRIKITDPVFISGSSILAVTGLLIMLTFQSISIYLCIASIIMSIIYPLTKRFLSVPQVFLGITYSMPILITGYESSGQIKIAHIVFFIGCSIFTFVYDSIYAMQDKEDDLKNEVFSSPIKFGLSFSSIMSKSYNISYSLFAAFGLINNLYIGFFIFLIISFILSKKLIKDLDSKETHEFQRIFNLSSISLLLLVFGIMIDIFYAFLKI